MSNQSIKEKRRARQNRDRIRKYLVIAVSIVGLAAIGWGILGPSSQVEIGEAAPEMPADHVQEGEDPGPYNTDPPSSGRHYASSLEAGFYTDEDLDNLGPFPEGYLVHNLEHGYVIFWYNCDLLSTVECTELKSQIEEVMGKERNFKVIAFPWQSLDVPVVMTSWTRMIEFEAFDPGLATKFVGIYRNQAPEPHAP
jgi:hypothetical protein